MSKEIGSVWTVVTAVLCFVARMVVKGAVADRHELADASNRLPNAPAENW